MDQRISGHILNTIDKLGTELSYDMKQKVFSKIMDVAQACFERDKRNFHDNEKLVRVVSFKMIAFTLCILKYCDIKEDLLDVPMYELIPQFIYFIEETNGGFKKELASL